MAHNEESRKRAYEKIKARRAKWLLENGPCITCGSTEDLEVDHVDPKLKTTHRVWTWAQDRLLAELAKCQVLCKKCHQSKSLKYMEQVTHRPPPHGDRNRYASKKWRCRCSLCTEAQKAYNARWRQASVQ